ncbi:glycosyltransferase [Polaribacter glomeratus]|uniref:Glycosyltransferase 2-like domain-containing protein n=1 Tax=Polaribacter glomeratus TaxID=102 RepID=A0A2S7WHW5_9FLAO|nr:glycosyltransferase [Polaribacter glomeratus]PQJ77190.1 hypothetical protein BTO16_15225 [Polaribacter glomeratus]TXD65160.1 glycosyltransferase [Polaribacter glomeratus]
MNRNNIILLIPHYKNIDGLYASLSSIDKNENLDVLIVDDGSNLDIDETKIRASFIGNGVVFFEYLKENSGIEIALNKGLNFSTKNKYKYTARLDCGDICVKDRFKIQETYLELHQDISLVGTNVDFLDTKGNLLYTLNVPEKDKQIRKKMFINAMHIHPTIMFRNSMLEITGLYPVDYKAAEDYAFFFNVINKCKVANINQVLVRCEINPNGISTLQRKKQAENRIKLILKNFYVGFYPIYGLFRSILLYIVPLKILIKLKSVLKK